MVKRREDVHEQLQHYFGLLFPLRLVAKPTSYGSVGRSLALIHIPRDLFVSMFGNNGFAVSLHSVRNLPMGGCYRQPQV